MVDIFAGSVADIFAGCVGDVTGTDLRLPCTTQMIAATVTTMTTPLAAHDSNTVRIDVRRSPPASGAIGFMGGMRPAAKQLIG